MLMASPLGFFNPQDNLLGVNGNDEGERCDETDQTNCGLKFLVGSPDRTACNDRCSAQSEESLHRQMRGHLPCEEGCLPHDTVQD